MMSIERVAIFWVDVNASSGEKKSLQFSIPTGSGAGREGGVSHSLKGLHTLVLVKKIKKFFIAFSESTYPRESFPKKS